MKRALLLIALLLYPVSLSAQHLVDDVNLPDVIHITDDSIPGFTPVAMTWDATTEMWSSAAGQFPVYHLRFWDDEHGEQYVVGVDYADVGILNAGSTIVSKPGTKPLVFYKTFPQFNISYYWAFITGNGILPIIPLPPSTYTVQ